MKARAEFRRRAGLTQVQLANLTGIPAPRICLWERGQIELRPEQVESIEHALRGELMRWLRSIDSELVDASVPACAY